MRHVLVVDDAALVRGLLRDILRREGFVVHEAVSCRDAVARYVEVGPDLVTLDLTLPDGSGLACLARLREIDLSARAVVITALDAERTRDAALEAGALGFVPKPFTPRQLVDAVRLCLSPLPVGEAT